MKLPPEIQDRIAPKFDWIRLLSAAPADSVLYSHDEACEQRCKQRDRRQGYIYYLSAATIHHVGTALANHAFADGTGAYAGLKRLAAETKRGRSTVIAALKHLEARALIYPEVRGGQKGIPRTWATIYLLTRPPLEDLAAAGLGPEVTGAYDWFARPPEPAGR